ncbi:MAG TPA: prolipoprotein diacylglyceryl transferase [Firmicutes bacterium]|uniref:Phosphatidylglycerol--prolipoprotein diacylglyceryl transferase n=1 Tax=Capillibacterium thermochitinicola TaxID=2699427 RepID=A0A8J6LLV0_9FIRM|nr:prolipoprotein diacylglyceryl transferase [Capillibacterium thermochitinicola]MBA2132799.1 prolipoprotein diacylglyceryl transferase [Capillibacterium thermochitinicola]HHW12960.1 prolipoprotein diacylglyceryl transferase [Bacillota bacterium]
MFPVLFSFGRFNIYSYGFMVALTLLCGLLWVGAKAQKRGIATFDQITDLAFYVIIGGLIFAKLVNVLYEFRTYLYNPAAIFSGFTGSFFGAVIGGVLVGVWYTKRAQIATWRLADLIALYIPLGHSLGRIGCLLSGCCYGVASNLPWALPCAADDPTLRHPTQLYEILANVLIFAVLVVFDRRVQQGRGRYFDGFIFGLYVGLYCLARTVVEVFRDSQILAFGWLRTTQVFSLAIGLVVLSYLFGRLKKQAGDERRASSPLHN